MYRKYLFILRVIGSGCYMNSEPFEPSKLSKHSEHVKQVEHVKSVRLLYELVLKIEFKEL